MALGIMATDVEQRIDFDALRAYKLERVRDQQGEKDLDADRIAGRGDREGTRGDHQVAV